MFSDHLDDRNMMEESVMHFGHFGCDQRRRPVTGQGVMVIHVVPQQYVDIAHLHRRRQAC
jgi:hypothetical protein